jgi:hypothetical protein
LLLKIQLKKKIYTDANKKIEELQKELDRVKKENLLLKQNVSLNTNKQLDSLKLSTNNKKIFKKKNNENKYSKFARVKLEDGITKEEQEYLDDEEAQKTREFLDKYASNELYLFENESDHPYLMLNIPFNEDNFYQFMSNYYTDYFLSQTYPEDCGTYKNYYKNKISSLEDIYHFLDSVVMMSNSQIMKFKLAFSVIWEARSTITNSFLSSSSSSSSQLEELDYTYQYYSQEVHTHFAQINPLLVVTAQNTQPLKDYAKALLKYIQGKNSDGGESSHRVVAVTKLMCTVYNCDTKIGGGPLNAIVYELVNNQYAYTVNLENLCLFGCLSYLLFPRGADGKKENVNIRNKFTRELFHRYNNTEGLSAEEKEQIENSYPGFNLADEDEIHRFMQFFDVSINIYRYHKDESKYTRVYSYNHPNAAYVLDVGLVTLDHYEHAIWLKDIDRATNCYVCKNCKINIFHNYHYYKEHESKCNGKKREKKLLVSRNPQIIHPNLMNNPILKYLTITNQLQKFKPTLYYITYDFETMEENTSVISNVEEEENTKTLSLIHPLSVSSCAKTAKGNIIRYFDIRDGDDFINQWLEVLFQDAIEVAEDNAYEDIDYSLEKIPNDVPVLGYNSSRFDLNFLLTYLHQPPQWFIETTIGELTNFKMTKVKSENGVTLKFLDAMNFTTPQSLAQFVKSFGSSGEEAKGIFAYESINTANVYEILDMKEPFKQEEFNSYLKNTTLNDKDYQDYLEDWQKKGFEDRWDYLEYYNKNDVTIMISPLDNLIAMMFKDGVDMLANITLASCAQCLKYQYCFKDFRLSQIKYVSNCYVNYSDNDEEDRVNENDVYDLFIPNLISNDSNSSSLCSSSSSAIPQYFFTITSEWMVKKCEGYKTQDVKKNRDVSNNITVNDVSKIQEIIKLQNNKCFICDEDFHLQKEPTFDRIDNHLSHSLNNIVLTCNECNRRRSNRSLEEVQLEVQLLKYAKANQLPLTLIDERVVALVQRGITGGLSNVYHRYNVSGTTKINKLHFDAEREKIVSKNTDNIMTHVTGVDFNSLYPSSYSSLPNEMIDYTNFRMLMPGNVTEFTKSKIRILDVLKKREDLFIVSLKGGIPRRRYNDFINFAPIFRNIDIGKQKKLTQLLSTMGTYMVFNNYYIWYLMDRFDFVIEDVEEMAIFEKNEKGLFTNFVQSYMSTRIQALKEHNSGLEKYCKMILNAAYGKDGMNTAKYTKIKFRNKHDTFLDQCLPNFVGARRISEDCYAVEKSTYFY